MPVRQLAEDYEEYEAQAAAQPMRQPEPEQQPEQKSVDVEVRRPVAPSSFRHHIVLNTRLRARFFLLIAALAVFSMVVTVRSSMIASHGYELVQMQQQAQKLEQENEHLRIENAKLRSPQRIGQIARDQLGMVTPKDVYFAAEK